jgi:hypothetical protein
MRARVAESARFEPTALLDPCNPDRRCAMTNLALVPLSAAAFRISGAIRT